MPTGAPLGEIIYSAVKPMFRLYMILFTGFGLTRMGLVGAQTARACSDLLLLIFMPALIFDKVVSYIDISDIKTIGVICFSACVMYGINACATTLIVFFTPIPKDPKSRWVGGAYLAGIMQNVSDLPIVYIQAISLFSVDQQNKGIAYVIIWLAMYVIFQFNLGLSQLVEADFKAGRKFKIDEEKNSTEHLKIPALIEPTHSINSEYPTSIETNDSTTIMDDGDDFPEALQINGENVKRRRGSNLAMDPIQLNLDKLSKVLSSQSRHTALSKIPSARNNNDDVVSLNRELVREYSHVEPYNQRMSNVMKIVTDNNISINSDDSDNNDNNKSKTFVEKYHLQPAVFFFQNFKKPNSVVLVISLAIALIPWLKALFTNNGTVVLPNAPDGKAALSFILMYAEYLGYPCVPLGVFLIGSVLARLEINNLPPGFWKSAVAHTTFRLGILPIIGMAYVTQLKKIGWMKDPMALFVTSLQFALPSATVQVYLTAAAMDPKDTSCPALNCLGLYLIFQYICLVVSLPIVACYCIKNVMEF